MNRICFGFFGFWPRLAKGIVIALALFAAESKALAAYLDSQGLPSTLPRIVLTRWPNSSSFASQTFLAERGGRFEPFFSWDMRLKHSDFCESLLMGAQLFPVEIMGARNPLTDADRSQMLRMGERLDPAQFHFADLIEVVEGEALQGRQFDARLGQISPMLLPLLRNNSVPVTQATLWTVAGQTSSSHSRLSFHAMPWQVYPDFARVQLDRSRFRMVWELGRGAQNRPGSIEALYRAQVLAMLNDVYAFGENLDDAYVFIHPLGVAQGRLITRLRHPTSQEPVFSPFASANEDPENIVYMARLRDLLAIYPPDEFSQRIQQVREASGGRLDWLGAYEHLFALRRALRADLNFRHPTLTTSGTPIILRNSTPITGWFMALVSQRYGLMQSGGPEIAADLSQVRWLENYTRGSHIVDEDVPVLKDFSRQKLFSISNLDPEVASRDPNYTRLVLLAAYLHYRNELRVAYPLQAEAILDRTEFVIHSSHEKIMEQARAIPGGVARSFSWQDIRSEMDTNGGNSIRIQPNFRMNVGPGFSFSSRTISAMAAADSQFTRLAEGALESGGWQTQNLINIVY